MRIDLPDQEATETLAARLVALARPGDAILPSGPLGAGQSTLARPFPRASAGDPPLEGPRPSFPPGETHAPTLGLVTPFGPGGLRGPDALVEPGWDELTAGIVLVEWPERLGALRPDDALEIALADAGEAARVATLTGWAERWR